MLDFFDVFAKALAQGADSVDGDETGRFPGLQTACDDTDILIAHPGQGRGGTGAPVKVLRAAVIHHKNGGLFAGDERFDAELETAEGDTAGQQDM